MKVTKKIDYSAEFYLADYRIKIKKVEQARSRIDQIQILALTT